MNSKKNKTKVLVFLPMLSYAGWKGEGISQTVEQIISESDKVEYTLLISKHCLNEVDQKVKDKVKIVTIGLNKSVMFVESRIMRLFYKLQFLMSLGMFVLKSLLLKLLRAENYDVVYVPTPILTKFAIFLGKKVVIAFWDPFVMEFCGFNYFIKRIVLREINFALHNSNAIITQSLINSDFLVNYFNIPLKKIFVIRNGVPNFKDSVFEQIPDHNSLIL